MPVGSGRCPLGRSAQTRSVIATHRLDEPSRSGGKERGRERERGEGGREGGREKERKGEKGGRLYMCKYSKQKAKGTQNKS